MVLKIYLNLRDRLRHLSMWMVPYARRLIRFLALPYCYFGQITWKECPASPLRVVYDLLYIFFRLKSYPENYSLCRLWNIDRKRWPLYYGPIADPYQRARLHREVQPPEYRIVFADKEICHHLCVAMNLPVPKAFGSIRPDEDYRTFIQQCLQDSSTQKVIVKPARGTKGRGVHLIEEDSGRIVAWCVGQQTALDGMRLMERSVVEEYVQQHPALAAIYPRSVNTVRLQTLLCRNGEVLIMGGFVRFGRNASCVDNVNAGGIPVPIDLRNGRLRSEAFDMQNRRYVRHPESGVNFDELVMPLWDRTVDLALRAQSCFPFYRMLGLDIATTTAGPVIIEINPEPDNAYLEAISGPIFANPRVLLEFDHYGLLVNGPTRALVAKLRAANGADRIPLAAA
jgi:hypothetical protein